MVQASNVVALAAMCAGLGTAAVIDIRHRRIPNVVCVATAAAGLTLATVGISGITVASALAGLAIRFSDDAARACVSARRELVT